MKLRIAGADLEVRVEGRGPAVVLLNAFPLPLAMWEPQVEALRDAFTLVRFDPRGLGASAPAGSILTMERIADDAAAVLEHAGFGQAAVCGVSMGGYAALAFARRHPQLLRALVLSDTRAGADSPEARQNRSLQSEKVRREGASALADAMVPKLLGRTTHAERPLVVALVKEAVLAAPPVGIVDALAGLAARADSTPSLRQLRVPTLVVCGEEDEITPVAEAQTLAAGIPGARLALIPRAGHLPNLEDPAAWNAAVRPFLQQNA